MNKINPHVTHEIYTAKRFLNQPRKTPAAEENGTKDVVTISSDGKKRHIMGQLMARITAYEDD